MTSNWSRVAQSFDFEVTHMVSCQTALHLIVQLPLVISISKCYLSQLVSVCKIVERYVEYVFGNFKKNNTLKNR